MLDELGPWPISQIPASAVFDHDRRVKVLAPNRRHGAVDQTGTPTHRRLRQGGLGGLAEGIAVIGVKSAGEVGDQVFGIGSWHCDGPHIVGKSAVSQNAILLAKGPRNACAGLFFTAAASTGQAVGRKLPPKLPPN